MSERTIQPVIPDLADAAYRLHKDDAKEDLKGIGTACAIAAARAFAAVVAHQRDMPKETYDVGCKRLAAKQEFLALRVWQEVWHSYCKEG